MAGGTGDNIGTDGVLILGGESIVKPRKLAANGEGLSTEHLKDVARQIQERYEMECGPVEETIDLSCLESLTNLPTVRKDAEFVPYLSLQTKRIRLSVYFTSVFLKDDRIEILASKGIIALRKSANGVAVVYQNSPGTKRPAIVINRRAIVRRLIEMGWAVGMKIGLQWDEKQQVWWGKRPREKGKGREER